MNAPELYKLTGLELLNEIKKQKESKDTTKNLKQYNVSSHDIYDTVKRPNKIITVNTGQKSQAVARIGVPFQKLIVDRSSSFLVGEKLNLVSNPSNEIEKKMVSMIDTTWYDAKLDYRTRELARLWMSETECAELWYFRDNETIWKTLNLGIGGSKSMRVKVLAKSLGDDLYPYYDEYGDLIAFARLYSIDKTSYTDIYTSEKVITISGVDVTEKVNSLGKIPIIYYNRNSTEWSDVQDMIDRYEKLLSNFADNNDYFASPIIKVKGEVLGFAEKGEQGKMITMGENADANYLTWDQAPEAIKLEFDVLSEQIMAMTQTPDITFNKVKGIGNVSGVALSLMFMDAKLKTLKHQEIFGECIQRRINLLKKGMSIISTSVDSAVDMIIKPEFKFYMPNNQQELINMLYASTGNKPILSQDTAVALNPFVTDTEKELSNIKQDESSNFGKLFPQQ